jgi:hypothetical protein
MTNNMGAIKRGVGEIHLLRMIANGEIRCEEDDGEKQEPSS